MMRRVSLAPSAERSLARLPEKVAAAIVAFIVGPLLESPEQVGRALRPELAGYWSAHRGACRVLYRIDNDQGAVRVVRIEHRTDLYRAR